MKRDFTEETKNKIIQYIKELDKPNIWEYMLDLISDIGLILKYLIVGKPNDEDKKAVEQYYKDIVDIKEYGIKEIKAMFKEANRLDRVASREAEIVYDYGEQLFKELQELTEIITPKNIKNPVNLKLIISNHTEAFTIHVDEDGCISHKENVISSPDVIKHCEVTNGEYSKDIFRNGQDTLSEIGIGDVILIALLGHKEIILEEILNAKGGADLTEVVVKKILNGEKGYDSIEAIAKELGVSENDVKHVLKNMKKYHYDPLKYVGDIPWIEKNINGIIERNIEHALTDEAVIIELSKNLGYDKETVLEILNGNTDGYAIAQYKKLLGDLIGENESFVEGNVYPDDIKRIINIINNGGILTEAKLKEKLNLDGMQYSSELLSSLIKWNNLNKAGHIGKDGIELISYWLSDYENSIQIIDMMLAGTDDPNLKIALTELKKEYNNKFIGTFNKFIAVAAEKCFDFAVENIPAPLSLAETAISIAGDVTGSSRYADAVIDIIGLQQVGMEVSDSYMEAIENVREGDVSEEALINVKLSFGMMKNAAIRYYDAQIKYAEGVIGINKKSQSYINYYKYEKKRIERLEMGQDFEPMSYEEYMNI